MKFIKSGESNYIGEIIVTPLRLTILLKLTNELSVTYHVILQWTSTAVDPIHGNPMPLFSGKWELKVPRTPEEEQQRQQNAAVRDQHMPPTVQWAHQIIAEHAHRRHRAVRQDNRHIQALLRRPLLS
jgi:hypothetical protein